MEFASSRHHADRPISTAIPCFLVACLLLTVGVATPRRVGADAIDDFVRGAMAKRSIPGVALAVVRDGKTIRANDYGVASLELAVPVSAQTIFPIASGTKIFTATLIMQLVQEGTLGLDDRLGQLLPGMPEAWSPVTLRQMLAHTSGLPDVIVNPMTGTWIADNLDDALTRAAALPLQFAPGTAWSYNQTNYVLLGAILTRRTGKSFETLVTERLLEPLGMQSTQFADARQVVTGRGPWYSRLDFSGPEPRLAARIYPTWVTYPDFVHPCAGLNTTALELARFVDRVAAGTVLTPATVAMMWQPQLLQDGTPAGMDPATGMGLGFLLEQQAGRTWVGGTGGATIAFRHAVAEKLTVVVLTNCQGADPDGMATEILTRLLEQPTKE